MALTDREVRAAKPAEKPYKLSDGGHLYLLVTPGGGKLWRYSYRFHGKERLMAFGKYPDVTLATARTLHASARTLLASGVDPMAERKANKQAVQVAHENSFASVAARWLAHWRVDKSVRHADTMERRLQANILPHLGVLPISSIDTRAVVTMAMAVDARGAGDLAKRAMQTTGQIFRFAIARGLAERNPVADIKPRDILTPTVKTNRARVDARELPELLLKMELYNGRHVTRLAMKLLALTFVRTRELIEAPWSEFDLAAGRWDIPKERMKMKSAHIVPLSRQAVAVLQELRYLTGATPWVFPGEGLAATMSNNTILFALHGMGFKGKMTGHGFRGLASTILHEQGFPSEHIELQLAHVPRNSVTAAYNHAKYLSQRTEMMQAWADYLDAALSRGRAEAAR